MTAAEAAPTWFASGERTEKSHLAVLARAAAEDPIVSTILDAVLGHVLILDRNRQILAGNQEILRLLGLCEDESLLGARSGEALGCIHAEEGPSGCGTSMHCRGCGAVLSILAAQETGQLSKGECHITRIREGMLFSSEYEVSARPIALCGEQCLVFVLKDISDLKRRELLEKVFMHDLRNSLTGLLGWSELANGDNALEASRHIMKLGRDIEACLAEHTALMLAENGELAVYRESVRVEEIFQSLESAVQGFASSLERFFIIDFSTAKEHRVFTDRVILNRILVNMAKNALEALPRGGSATAYFTDSEEGPVFAVHNDGQIPEEIALHIFERTFTTKKMPGRGLGTYGMKLLGESYLKGRVEFSTSSERGTEFRILLPRE